MLFGHRRNPLVCKVSDTSREALPSYAPHLRKDEDEELATP